MALAREEPGRIRAGVGRRWRAHAPASTTASTSHGGGAGGGVPYVPWRGLVGHRGPVETVVFNREGRYCISGGQDGVLNLWNPYRAAVDGEGTGGYLIKQYVGGHSHGVTDAAIAPDSTTFVSCGVEKCAVLWDTSTGAIVRKYYGHDARVASVAFNADASIVVTGSHDKCVRCFDTRSHTRAPVQVMSDARDNVTTVLCEPDGIVSGSMDGVLRRYDLRLGRRIEDALATPIAASCWTRDGNCVVVACPSGGSGSGRLILLDRGSGAVLNTYAGHINSSYRLTPCLTADDAMVVCGSENGEVVVWDLVDATVVHRLKHHRRAVSCVAHHPRMGVAVMATASFDGTVQIWAGPGQDMAALTVRADAEEVEH